MPIIWENFINLSSAEFAHPYSGKRENTYTRDADRLSDQEIFQFDSMVQQILKNHTGDRVVGSYRAHNIKLWATEHLLWYEILCCVPCLKKKKKKFWWKIMFSLLNIFNPESA